MVKVKFALFCVVPFLYAGMAMAQTPPPPVDGAPSLMGHHHPDMAAMHKEMCSDRQAAVAAKLAFVETRLDLTEAQKPLFNKWRQQVQEGTAKAKAACLAIAPKGDMRPTIVERQALEVTLLTAKLQILQSSHAALQAFYDSLTPAQREILDRPRHGRDGHQGWQEHEEHGMMMKPGQQ